MLLLGTYTGNPPPSEVEAMVKAFEINSYWNMNWNRCPSSNNRRVKVKNRIDTAPRYVLKEGNDPSHCVSFQMNNQWNKYLWPCPMHIFDGIHFCDDLTMNALYKTRTSS